MASRIAISVGVANSLSLPMMALISRAIFLPLSQQDVRRYSCHHTDRVKSARTRVELPIPRVAADFVAV